MERSLGCAFNDEEGSGSYLCVGLVNTNVTPLLTPNVTNGEESGNPDDFGLILFFVIIIFLYLCSCLNACFRYPITQRM